MYTAINIESSYRKNDLGKTLYNIVLEKRPTTIVEFGCLYGYSAVAMGLALRDLGRGKIISYDLWDKYAYKHTTPRVAANNIAHYGLSDVVEFRHGDFWEWVDSENREHFDLLHLDISNDGQTILDAYNKLKPAVQQGASILFEGGSFERDQEQWMIKYNKKPINDVSNITKYAVLNHQWPSISIINE